MRLHKQENKLYDLEEDFCLFDITNSYFEGFCNGKQKI